MIMSPKGVYIRKPLTEQHKKNISDGVKRCKNHPTQFKKDHKTWNKDMKMSEEFCKNTSDGHKG